MVIREARVTLIEPIFHHLNNLFYIFLKKKNRKKSPLSLSYFIFLAEKYYRPEQNEELHTLKTRKGPKQPNYVSWN